MLSLDDLQEGERKKIQALILNMMPEKILDLYRLAQKQGGGQGPNGTGLDGNLGQLEGLNLLMEKRGDLINIAFDYFDLILKVESKYDQGLSVLYWVSFTELLMCLLNFILIINIHRFALVVLYLPHLVRGIVGFMIYRSMPEVDEFI